MALSNIERSHLELQYELYLKGIPVLHRDLQALKDNGFIEYHPVNKLSSHLRTSGRRVARQPFIFSSIDESDADELIEIIDNTKNQKVLNTPHKKEIKTEDWMPNSIVRHTGDFVKFINSIRFEFPNIYPYKKFNDYVAQAEYWFHQYVDVYGEDDPETQYDLMLQEVKRCDENSLYAVNKYFYLQDEDSPMGRSKLYITEHYLHQQIMCFLFDSGYSMFVGKPRQFGGTTIFGMIAINRVIARGNYFIKFITEDKEKGLEIFEDKIKFAFYSLPDWFIPHTQGKPDVLNDREGYMRLGRKGQKGRIEGLNSRIKISAPYKTAVNGGTPSLVLIDEAGSIDIFSTMLNEGRPTMFKRDPVTGKMEQKRQVVAWGTGTTSKGGAAWEKEYKKARGAWDNGDWSYGIIPLMFNWESRCDEEEYLSQKRYYYGSRSKDENIDAETSRVQFHQHYPSDEEDMFASTEKLLVNREDIRKGFERINDLPADKRSIWGYLEPIYDYNKPLTNPYVQYAIVGAEFHPCDEDDVRANTEILHPPQSGWKWRYGAGTDPIASDTGLSNMSTTIWDEIIKGPAAKVSFREPNNPKENFLASALLCLLYDPDGRKGCPELVEKNIGLAYREFKENIGLEKNLIYESELSEILRSSESLGVGVDNKGKRAITIINKMSEIYQYHGEKIHMRSYWAQLKTFESKPNRNGTSTWQSKDPRYYKDDDLFSLTFAKMAVETFPSQPKDVSPDKTNIATKYKFVYDTNMNLIRVPVVKILKDGKAINHNREKPVHAPK